MRMFQQTYWTYRKEKIQLIIVRRLTLPIEHNLNEKKNRKEKTLNLRGSKNHGNNCKGLVHSNLQKLRDFQCQKLIMIIMFKETILKPNSMWIKLTRLLVLNSKCKMVLTMMNLAVIRFLYRCTEAKKHGINKICEIVSIIKRHCIDITYFVYIFGSREYLTSVENFLIKSRVLIYW